jgi:hypothetical protein
LFAKFSRGFAGLLFLGLAATDKAPESREDNDGVNRRTGGGERPDQGPKKSNWFKCFACFDVCSDGIHVTR